MYCTRFPSLDKQLVDIIAACQVYSYAGTAVIHLPPVELWPLTLKSKHTSWPAMHEITLYSSMQSHAKQVYSGCQKDVTLQTVWKSYSYS